MLEPSVPPSSTSRSWRERFGAWHRALWPEPPPDWPKFLSWRWLVKFVICCLIATVLPIIDPFGAEHAARYFSRDLYSLLMGMGFPSSLTLPKQEEDAYGFSPNDVTVVLIDERSREKNRLPNEKLWPPSGGYYGLALDAILAYEPAAVFMDILFLRKDMRPEPWDPVADAFRNYEAASVPLLLVAQQDEGEPQKAPADGEENLPADFAAALRANDESTANPSKENIRTLEHDLSFVEFVHAPVSRKDVIVRTYPLAKGTGTDARPSAASRLYQIATKGEKPINGPDMHIVWDTKVAVLNKKWMTCSAAAEEVSLVSRVISMVLEHDALKQTCPAIQTVPLIDILVPGRDQDAMDLIKGKLVVFGADVIGGDVYPTPIKDALPGVYIHAMALENLMAFGKRYVRADRTVGLGDLHARLDFGPRLSVGGIFEVAIIAFVVSLLGGWGQHHGQARTPFIEKLLRIVIHDGVIGLSTMALALSLSMILMPTLLLAPLNWIAVGGIAALTREVIHWFPMDEWFIRLVGHLWRQMRTPAPREPTKASA
jgi:hypothetical protein